MSVQAMAWVLESSATSGTDRLVLLSIANHADPHGANAWPSMSTIAREANVHVDTARRSVRSLVAAGLVVREVNRGGLPETPTDRRPNRYRVVMADPTGCDDPSYPVDRAGRTPDPVRVGRSVVDGCDDPSHLTVLEPPENQLPDQPLLGQGPWRTGIAAARGLLEKTIATADIGPPGMLEATAAQEVRDDEPTTGPRSDQAPVPRHTATAR